MMRKVGELRKNEIGRWEIFFSYDDSRFEITSGDVCEVKVAGHWIRTRVEHNGTDYYAVVSGVKLFTGMLARRCEQ